ncbi:uncharacterized protein LOC123556401 [Mercenaria mercenaria]|uniref:uncharacterized protein LOC123556401 n=1 Tax=Mercenaria mercenaria TaxID=6596 RepID=UPI00234F4E93|nr:uncharacterized protein LOC123556401 [Mercenaria mercenaria]
MATQISTLDEGLKCECKPCLRDGKNVGAKIYCHECEEGLCMDCNTYHKKIKSSLNHNVCDIETKSKEIEAGQLLRQLTRCPDHKHEEVKYLCNDHDVLCCNECAIVNHRKCENLVCLNEESSNVSTDDGISAEKKLEELENSIDILSEGERKKYDGIKETNTEIQRELNDFKTKIENACKKLETTVLQDVKERCNCVLETSSANASKISHLKSKVSLLKQTAEAVRSNASTKCQILFERKLGNELHELEEQMLSLSDNSLTCKIRLVELKPVNDIIESISNCLQVKENSSEFNSQESPASQIQAHEGNSSFRQRNATLEKELDYDSYGCPKYCTWAGKYIIVALQDQLELLQFDAEKMTFLSTYKCLSYPCSMTRINDTTIAVSLPEVQSIIVMNVLPRQLELKTKISSKFAYHAISYNESVRHLICLSQTAGAIDFMDVDGHQKFAVPVTKNEVPKLQSAHAVAFDQQTERIYVSSTDWDTVIALDKSGTIFKELTNGENVNLRGPLDVVLDSENNVYVFGRGGNPILQCDKDLNVIREIMHTESKLEYAYSMSFNKDMSKFVISEQHGLGSLYLKVYSFK